MLVVYKRSRLKIPQKRKFSRGEKNFFAKNQKSTCKNEKNGYNKNPV